MPVGFPKNTKITVTTSPKSVIQVTNRGAVGGGSGATRLRELKDVDATAPDENDTLVYDAATGKYTIKEIPRINGGEF